MVINTIRIKKMTDGSSMPRISKLRKLPSDWFLWMHHTINEIPSNSQKKYDWQKSHSENLSGSDKAYKPNKISKERKKQKL